MGLGLMLDADGPSRINPCGMIFKGFLPLLEDLPVGLSGPTLSSRVKVGALRLQAEFDSDGRIAALRSSLSQRILTVGYTAGGNRGKQQMLATLFRL